MSNATQRNGIEQPTVLAPGLHLRVGLAGGSETERAAVKEVIIRVREVDTEIVDLGDEVPHSGIDPKIGLLTLLLDPADQAGWVLASHPAASSPPALLTIVLFADPSSQLIHSAMRAGADDVLKLPPSPEDMLRALLRASEARRRAEGSHQRKICSLVSVSGGRGVSSLTVCLGFAAQRLLEKRAALVDLDLQAAPLSVLLDVEPEHTIADLADPTSPIDSIRLESVLTKHNSGPALLAAPKRIEQTELVSVASIEAAIKVLHDLFDVVLVDCGSHLNEGSVAVFERSDYLLYVLDQSVTGVRAAQRFLALYESLELKRLQLQLIINRYQQHDVVKREQIEAALQLPVLAMIPYDHAAFKEMQTTGHDLWNVSAGVNVRRSFEKLSRQLFAAGSESAAKPRLFSRLFGLNR
jgi:pilus assembly protein CpaE